MKKLQAKTILTVLPLVDKYCESISKANYTRAINSYQSTDQDTYQVMESIIDKTYKSQVLHNLKVKSMKQLESAPQKLGEVIKLFFLQSQKTPKIAKQLGVSERTVFRLINNGVEWFTDNLENIGINTFTFRQLLANYGWIKNIYHEFSLQ